MRKSGFRLLTLLLLVLFCLQPLSASAEAVDASRNCSLELEYSSNGTYFSDLEIHIYRIAEIYTNGNYALVAPFSSFPVNIHGISSQKEWRDTANTMAAYIASQRISPTQTVKTNASGKAAFHDLDIGIYLVTAVSANDGVSGYHFENFCVFLPRPQTDGTQLYDLTAKPKCTITHNPEEPQEITYQVVKLWKDAGIQSQRPKSITVDILKNTFLQKTVILSADNDWTYSWTVTDETDIWQVVEKDVPDQYSVVITSSATVFTITNSRSAPTGDPPKTGDTFALRPWLIVMCCSGMLLLACGILQKRKKQ